MIFLDRDGVINEDSSAYVKSVDEWHPIPGSLSAIARLSRAGYRIAVVTNQSGLARGLFDREALEAIHGRLRESVEAEGGRIDGFFVCPHQPGDGCGCRKPATGLIEAAERELGVRTAGAPLVGDKGSDLEAARRAGCRPVLIESGRGVARVSPAERSGVSIYPDLAAFAQDLLGGPEGGDQP